MSILSKEQILAKLKERIGEDTSDEALQFIEDVSDTVNDNESRTKDKTDVEQKYKENDENWRKKYKERFFNNSSKEDEEDDSSDDDDDKINKLTYDNLFKEEKNNG